MKANRMQIAASMRKLAVALRDEAKQCQQAHHEKCAKILVAARGLGTLQQLLKGVSDANR